MSFDKNHKKNNVLRIKVTRPRFDIKPLIKEEMHLYPSNTQHVIAHSLTLLQAPEITNVVKG